MSDYLGEESPWARPSFGSGGLDDGSPFGDAATPWVAPRDTSDEDEEHDSFNPYSDPYGDDNAPLAPAGVSNEGSDAASDKSSAPAPAEEEPTLKPRSTAKGGARAGRKKRNGGGVKVEKVNGADPLLAAAKKTDEFTDVSLAKSTADLSLDGVESAAEGAGAGAAGSPAAESASLSRESPALHTPPAPAPAPDFEISVSDPSKVRDMTNQYTVYTVNMSTTNAAFEEKEASVQRRYRDFRWLYHTLEHNHPGVIVPPPPDKQAMGRFNDEFVQQRRQGLEQMLKKIVAHKLLKTDTDLIAFLTSPDFAEYLKQRLMDDEELERATGSVVASGDYPSTGSSSSGNGIIGTLSGALHLSRGAEADPWTVDKRQYLDTVETQLRTATRTLAAVGVQRQQLSDTVSDFANATRALADVEPTRRLSTVLRAFAKVHERLSQLYARQKQQDLLTLESTLDEHLRGIASIRNVLVTRQRVFSKAESAAAELEKRQAALERLQRQGRTQEDRHHALEDEVKQLTERAGALHRQAADIAHLVESEMVRVETEKTVEFRNSVELYLETAVESQKEAIEIWETFYSRYFANATQKTAAAQA